MTSMSSVVRDIADALDGSEYPLYVPASISKQAMECGVQIIYGESDDLIEFEGPFRDELGAWISEDGGTRDYVSSEGRRITAVWGETEKVSWTYRTDIPHETFRIIDEDDDDDETYCIGIVFEAMPGETWSEEERYVGGEGMRFTEIDGQRYDVAHCSDCPFVFHDGLIPVCNHPDRSGVTDDDVIPEDCPLKSTDLLPCPFCGGEAKKITLRSENSSKECVRCTECNTQTAWSFGIGNDDHLAGIWNRRVKEAEE